MPMNRGAPGVFAQEGALDVAHRAATANRCGGRRLTRRTSNTACILLGATIWPTFEADIEGRGEVLPWIAVQENKVGLAAPPAGACSALVLTFSAVEIMSDQFALRYRISSAAGLRGVKNSLAYAVVKGAIPQFVRALAFELSDANIRVNCISPGVIRTRFQDYLTNEQIKNNIENRIPLHREGTPEDVADAICMLVKNNFITGENIVIDGGMTMRIV